MKIQGQLMTARIVWSALGEHSHEIPHFHAQSVTCMNFTKKHYDDAAKRAFDNKSATVHRLQYSAIRHANLETFSYHAFIRMACGEGKSGIYNLLILAAWMNSVKPPRIIVISPHNSLLSQHKQQSLHYFRQTSLEVRSLLPIDITLGDIPDQFDLLYISIHGLNDLMKKYPQQISKWNLKLIIIDEYHNVFGEHFRLDSSWSCLRLLSVHKVKIMCFSATADEYLMDRIGQYLGMGNYKILGSTDNYPIPQVSITITRINADSISLQVVNRCLQLKCSKTHTFQIHVIAFTKKDAENIILSLKESNISCLSLTSDNLQADKEDIMTLWGQGRHLVLVSTYVDGIDSPFTEDVIIAGCSHSVVNVIQGIGRIRRPCQAQKEATLHILSSDNYFHHQDDLIDIVTKLKDADLLPDDKEAVVYFQKLFHITGYHTFICHTGCLRKYLFLQLGITSENCHLCSNCYQKNDITKSENY